MVLQVLRYPEVPRNRVGTTPEVHIGRFPQEGPSPEALKLARVYQGQSRVISQVTSLGEEVAHNLLNCNISGLLFFTSMC